METSAQEHLIQVAAGRERYQLSKSQLAPRIKMVESVKQLLDPNSVEDHRLLGGASKRVPKSGSDEVQHIETRAWYYHTPAGNRKRLDWEMKPARLAFLIVVHSWRITDYLRHP